MAKIKIKTTTRQIISVQDWDDLVEETYGKPYSFQQQDGCKDRGIEHIRIPFDDCDDEQYENIPFQINGPKMGVKFSTWLSTTVEDINNKHPESYPEANKLFWERNFYPDFQTIANDLYNKGLIDAGDYSIEIDW